MTNPLPLREREGTREAGKVRGLLPEARCGGSPLTFPLLRNGSPPLPQGERRGPTVDRHIPATKPLLLQRHHLHVEKHLPRVELETLDLLAPHPCLQHRVDQNP